MKTIISPMSWWDPKYSRYPLLHVLHVGGVGGKWLSSSGLHGSADRHSSLYCHPWLGQCDQKSARGNSQPDGLGSAHCEWNFSIRFSICNNGQGQGSLYTCNWTVGVVWEEPVTTSHAHLFLLHARSIHIEGKWDIGSDSVPEKVFKINTNCSQSERIMLIVDIATS